MSKELSIAYGVVATAFSGKFDKGGRPYFEHCLAVMNGLPTGLPERVYIAALCHDIIEDIKDGRDLLLRAGISVDAVVLVDLVSKVKGESYKQYKDKVMSNEYSMLIKKSDLTHNSDIRRLKGIGSNDIIRTIQYQEFYTEIVNKLENTK